jgi:aspartate/methionine/tyrosine aminotransferase
MKIKEFKLERYFAKYEFSTPHLLCCSDCEPLSLKELLNIADTNSRKMWDELGLGYTESQGHPVLREEIARLYKTINAENVIVVTPEEGIYIAIHTILNKGDHVITTFPGYQSLYEIANSLKCKVSKWEPIEQDDWVFNINELSNLIRENTKLIIINFPHNPTGATLYQHELEEIVEIAKQKNIFLFSDEMYRYLEHNENIRISSASDLYDNAVSLFGMSKSFALAGLRIGWLTTKNTALLKQFSEYKDYTTICSSAPSEVLSVMALRAKDKILRRNHEIIHDNLKLLEDFFSTYNKRFEWIRPKAGPICFPKLTEEIPVDDFCAGLRKKKGVLLLPADLYDYDRNNFRLGFARKNMPESLSKLEEYINENL